MALDKQKILSELGSVVNQLQSADCGCMGKLFSNSNSNDTNMNFQQMGGQGYGQCHHHGHGGCCRGSCGGDNMNKGHCMGHCNPPKLYADTYSYLNQNLMQPVVNEVYNDLKTLNPKNALSNSPLAAQMGLPSTPNNAFNQNTNSPTAGGIVGQHNPMATGNMNQPQMGANNYQMNPAHNMAGGMGPDIMKNMNMFSDNSQAKNNQMNAGNMNQVQGGNYQNVNPQMAGSGAYGEPMKPILEAPHSPQENLGNSAISPGMYSNANPHSGVPGSQQMTAYPIQNAYQSNPMSTGGAIGHRPGHHHHSHGQHQAGMTKFSEIFPGVMQGDLGFDPMALAIQMNPENQKQTAISTMQDMMMGNKRTQIHNPETAQSLQAPNEQVMQQQSMPIQASSQQIASQQGIPQTYTPSMHDSRTGMQPQTQHVIQYGQQVPGQIPVAQGNVPVQQQQIYRANTQQPTSQVAPAASLDGVAGQQSAPHDVNQQFVHTSTANAQPDAAQYAPVGGKPHYAVAPTTGTPQYVAAPQYTVAYATGTPQYSATHVTGVPQYSPAQVASNTQAAPAASNNAVYPSNIAPAGVQGYGSNVVAQPPHRPLEPSYTVDTSRNPPMDFNTLGQPVELVPAESYKMPYDNVPLTLSPTPVPMKSLQRTFSNVKNTVSKTSLTGNVLGSKSLQHAYDVYKTSQSYANPSFGSAAPQAVRAPAPLAAPIERFAGDVPMNVNPSPPMKSPAQQIMGRMGDAPMSTPMAGDAAKIPIYAKEPPKHTEGRNGIQDQTFTQYPMSTSWSFHGTYR